MGFGTIRDPIRGIRDPGIWGSGVSGVLGIWDHGIWDPLILRIDVLIDTSKEMRRLDAPLHSTP
jgi:hypothetical protein